MELAWQRTLMADSLDFTQDLSPEFDLRLEVALAAPSAQQSPGAPIIPGYLLVEKLASDSAAERWKSVQQSTGQWVMVEVFDQASPQRIQELGALVKLGNHPFLLHILEAKLEHHPPFLVFALLSKSLQAWMKSHAHAAEMNSRVSAWLGEAALGLNYVHKKRLVHCDLRPSNFLLDSQETLRISDFGWGHSRGNWHSDRSPSSWFFLAPEQILACSQASTRPHPAWDLYSLGATFYYLLTTYYPRASLEGLRALEREDQFPQRNREAWIRIHTTPLVPILEYNPEVEVGLAVIVERCLELSSAKRYASASAILEDLQTLETASSHPLDSFFYRLRRLTYRLGI